MVPPKDVPHFKAGKELRERVDSQRNDHGLKHITPADGNVFLDLGFEPEEAAKLLAETDKQISEKLANKERLDKVSDDVVRAESEFNGRARKIGVQEKNCCHDWQRDGQTMMSVRWTCAKCGKTELL